MPQRILRPAIRQSRRWNRLSYFEQTFYVRLLTIVDDYGRYDADAELLRSECFPFGDPNGDAIPLLSFDSALLTFASKSMLVLYSDGPHQYLQLLQWKERTRSESRWPDPKKCKMLANDSKCQQMIASPSPSPSPSPTSLSICGGMSIPVAIKTATNAQVARSTKSAPSVHRHSFLKPTIEAIKLQCAKIGLPDSEAIHFFNHYESNGWRVGRNPMRSWPHALQNWKLNYRNGTYEHSANRNPKELSAANAMLKRTEAEVDAVIAQCSRVQG